LAAAGVVLGAMVVALLILPAISSDGFGRLAEFEIFFALGILGIVIGLAIAIFGLFKSSSG
jgi:hypothetical protein